MAKKSDGKVKRHKGKTILTVTSTIARGKLPALVKMLNAGGVPCERFGDSTGPLSLV